MCEAMAIMVGNVLQVQLAVCFKEVEDGEEERNQSASHTLVLRSKGQTLCICLLQEDVFCYPFAHEVGQLGSDM